MQPTAPRLDRKEPPLPEAFRSLKLLQDILLDECPIAHAAMI